MVKNLAISIDFCMFFFVHFGCSQLAEKWFIFGLWNLNEVYFYIYLFDGKKTIETTFSFSVFFFFSSFVHSLIQSRRSKMWLRLFFFYSIFFMNHRYWKEYCMDDESAFFFGYRLIWRTKYKLFNEPNI